MISKERECRAAIAFPEYVREFLYKEGQEIGVRISNLVNQIVSNHVREEKKLQIIKSIVVRGCPSRSNTPLYSNKRLKAYIGFSKHPYHSYHLANKC